MVRPRIVSVSGTTSAELADGGADLTIGRDAANTIQVKDPAVSSWHCAIVCDDGRFVLVDRNSRNGTFVNGRPETRAPLKHGDEIRVGYERFYFLVEEGGPAAVTIEESQDDKPFAGHTMQLDPLNSAFLRAQVAAGDAQTLQRRARDMSVLLKLNADIHNIPDSEGLQNSLLQRIFEIIPAEDGVILLGNSVNRLLPGARLLRDKSGTLYLPRTILQQVMSSGCAMLRNDLPDAGDLTDSVRASGLRSVLCVPLTVTNVQTGVLYLSTRNSARPFDAQHLEMAVAIAGIGAIALEHARYVEWLEVQNRLLSREVNFAHGMVGENAHMKQVYEAIARVAPTSSPVLILGESGTGKELAARAIHNGSKRCNGPFVPVNCGAVVETLFASQLFGYVRGAFTGADRDHKGFIEDADGGTLFLDELGDLPPHCQAAMLRVLEEGKVQRVGSSREIAVDVRIISATNRSLPEEIRKGNFRSDLYFRMGLPVQLPPLRDRLDDIPLLVSFFLQKYKSQTQRELGPTHPDTIRVLQQYSWPGNVRELGRAIRWAVVFGGSDRIRPEDLPPEISVKDDPAAEGVLKLEEALQSYEKQLIARALEKTRGNVVEAAALLDRAPNYLQRRISHLDLRAELDRIRGAAGATS
jgi:transcriptional regulator with GAF, ATPase, and Fis domain